MRILITGAGGFAGRHLCDLLLQNKGNEILGTYVGDRVELRSVQMLACDLRDGSQVRRVVRRAMPDRIYHLAALSSVQNSFENAVEVHATNFTGCLNLLESVRLLSPKSRVLLVGSSQVYGVPSGKGKLTESAPLLPHSPYAVSKAAADLLGYQYFYSKSLHIIRARPFNHTGPGQSAHFVCSDFARQVAAIDLGLQAPTISVGNVRVQRDFSDVRDVVRAYQLLLEKGTAGEAYNVASGKLISISEIVRILQGFTPRKIRITVEKKRVRLNEPPAVVGDNRKLHRATGWKPMYRFRQTLHELFAQWRSELAAV